MYIKLIGVLAIEERHRRASLWAQPSVSETDTPNLAPVPSTQPQNSPLNPSVANVNPSPIASSQCQATTTDTPNLAPVPTSSPQPQNSPADPLIANVNPSTIASSQYQATTTDIPNLAPVPTSRRPVSSPQPQNSPANPLIANVSLSPVTSSQRQATTTGVTSLEFQTTPSTLSIANVTPSPITSSQYQATTTDIPNLAPVPTSSPQPQNSPADSLIANVNLSPVTSSQRQATTTAVTSLQFQTTPSTLTSPQSTSAFYYHPTMLQSGVEFPKPNSPLTEFLESTSPSGLYAWDNNMSTSSNSFDFSGMNSPQQLTLDAGHILEWINIGTHPRLPCSVRWHQRPCSTPWLHLYLQTWKYRSIRTFPCRSPQLISYCQTMLPLRTISRHQIPYRQTVLPLGTTSHRPQIISYCQTVLSWT